MSATIVLKETFELLKSTCYGLPVELVDIVGLKEKTMSAEERLSSRGISFDEVVGFESTNEESLISSYGESPDLHGWVNFYLKDGGKKAAIFIVDKRSENEGGGYLKMYTSLIHELGHVSDFVKEVTYNMKERTSDTVKSEVYAEVFTLHKLRKNSKNPIDKIVRSIYASSLIARSDTSPFYEAVHLGIVQKINKKNLKKWASEI